MNENANITVVMEPHQATVICKHACGYDFGHIVIFDGMTYQEVLELAAHMVAESNGDPKNACCGRCR